MSTYHNDYGISIIIIDVIILFLFIFLVKNIIIFPLKWYIITSCPCKLGQKIPRSHSKEKVDQTICVFLGVSKCQGKFILGGENNKGLWW